MTTAVSYGEFSLALHDRLADKRTPMEVSLEVTRRCPLECQHCYNNLPMGDVAARNRELSKEEYFSVLDELSAMGVFMAVVHRRRNICAQRLPGDLHLREAEGFPDHFVHKRNPHQ